MKLVSLFCVVAFGAFSTLSAAWSATNSNYEIVGFSNDGKVLVVEEYWLPDAEGSPTSKLYIIDTETDRWILGSPHVSKLSDDESFDSKHSELELLNKVRRLTFENVGKTLKKIGSFENGISRVKNSVFDFSNDAKKVRFSTVLYQNTVRSAADQKVWRLEVGTKNFPASDDKCFGFVNSMKGLRLTLIEEETGQRTVLNDDKRIPKSRPCPLDYRIEEVVSHQADNTITMVVIIRMTTIGFEGNDGKILVITTRIPRS